MPVMLGGSRHYGIVSADPWVCPACSAEQTGPIPDGCTICGAGKPGQKVGDPVPPQFTGDVLALHEAFTAWKTGQTLQGIRENPLFDAFTAGYALGRAAGLQMPSPTPIPRPEVSRDVPLTPAGAQARTLAAALALFIEQALVNQPEEIEAGEWLDLDAARALLAQLQADGRR